MRNDVVTVDLLRRPIDRDVVQIGPHRVTIAFTDDGCRLAPDYLVNLVRAYDGDVGPAFRGSCVELGDTRDFPFTIKADLVSQEFTAESPGAFLHAFNLPMSRSDFPPLSPTPSTHPPPTIR